MSFKTRYELVGVAPAPKRRRGRPPHVPTPESRALVAALAVAGYADEMVAAHLDISPATLDKYYSEEVALALAKANTQVVGALFKNVASGDLASMVFALTHLGGWEQGFEEPQVQVTHTYPEGDLLL